MVTFKMYNVYIVTVNNYTPGKVCPSFSHSEVVYTVTFKMYNVYTVTVNTLYTRESLSFILTFRGCIQ